MTVFRVGPDDSKTGLFGHPRTTVELEDAINNSISGDTILIQAGYSTPQPSDLYTITKNIIIAGDVDKNDTDNFPIIYDELKADGGASVTIKNLNFCIEQSKRNALWAVNKSDFQVENVNFYNTLNQGKIYPLIILGGGSTGSFNNITVNSKQETAGCICAKEASTINILNSELNVEVSSYNSKVSLVNSRVNWAILGRENSKVIARNSVLSHNGGNAIDLKSNSSIDLLDSKVYGGDNKHNYPCVYISNAFLSADNTEFIQPKFHTAINLTDNSHMDLANCLVSSISSYKSSELNLTNTCRIFESIRLYSKSKLNADTLLIDGKPNRIINLFATQGSSIKADRIGFGLDSNPSVKLEESVTINSELYMFEYDKNQDEYLLSENDKYIPTDKQVNIEYFKAEKSGPKSQITLKAKSVEHKMDKKLSSATSASTELDRMIGLKKVKQQVKEFVAVSVMDKKRQEKGLPTSAQTLHSIFAGNPGTGKTTVARILGHLLYEKGVIKQDKLVETSRADLVGEYIGETAPKTRKVLKSALGGILFIDEAYTLTPTSGRDYGGEAIDEILKFMEDHRSEIMIIFAGYSNEMKKFLQSNPGLKSRIPNTFEFEDYTTDEMIQIGLSSLKKQKYKIDEDAYTELLKHNLSFSNDNSNGRWVRNFNESILKKQAIRLALRADDVSDEELVTITQEDLDAVRK